MKVVEIEIKDNPNKTFCDLTVFQEEGLAKPIRGLKVQIKGQDMICDVVSVEAQDRFGQAYVCPIADSGEGQALLVYGGLWGIRLRPEAYAKEEWDLTNTHQWGESYKIYGSENDIVYIN